MRGELIVLIRCSSFAVLIKGFSVLGAYFHDGDLSADCASLVEGGDCLVVGELL